MPSVAKMTAPAAQPTANTPTLKDIFANLVCAPMRSFSDKRPGQDIADVYHDLSRSAGHQGRRRCLAKMDAMGGVLDCHA